MEKFRDMLFGEIKIQEIYQIGLYLAISPRFYYTLFLKRKINHKRNNEEKKGTFIAGDVDFREYCIHCTKSEKISGSSCDST